MMYVLGFSCDFHDTAACLLEDGRPVAAAAEERFTRKKHDERFPERAIDYCLREVDIDIEDVDEVVFYEKPVRKFSRVLSTVIEEAPFGYTEFTRSMTDWLQHKLQLERRVRNTLDYEGPIRYEEHHRSHAASSFYASPFEEAAILTIDGVGERTTAAWGTGSGTTISLEQTMSFPHSLGLLYSAFTSYLGFEVNNGEYKVMGLAAYGEPEYEGRIRDELLTLHEDRSFELVMDYFRFTRDTTSVGEEFDSLFDSARREPDEDLHQVHFDIAASIQAVTEQILLDMTSHVYSETTAEKLCLAGGVALNSVANGRIRRESQFQEVYIPPAAGDDGGSYGAAASVYFSQFTNQRTPPENRQEGMNGAFLGPQFGSAEIRDAVENWSDPHISSIEFDDLDELLSTTASLLADSHVVGFFQGRMEWGPRALGNRSILADPRDEEMNRIVNRKIKFREEFRPFAPSVLAERAPEYFEIDDEASPFMLYVYDVVNDRKDEIPAVVHVDGTARIQTVHEEWNKRYHSLISAFAEETGVPVVLNTSLNRRGEPIVRAPDEAIRCLADTGLDYLCFPDAGLLIDGRQE